MKKIRIVNVKDTYYIDLRYVSNLRIIRIVL